MVERPSGDLGLETGGHAFAAGSVTARKHDEKTGAASAADRVIRAELGPDPIAHRPQDRSGAIDAEGGLDLVEALDLGQYDRHRLTRAGAPCQLAAHDLDDGVAVEQPGQRIVLGPGECFRVGGLEGAPPPVGEHQKPQIRARQQEDTDHQGRQGSTVDPEGRRQAADPLLQQRLDVARRSGSRGRGLPTLVVVRGAGPLRLGEHGLAGRELKTRIRMRFEILP